MWFVTPRYLFCKAAIICHFLLLLGYVCGGNLNLIKRLTESGS